MTQELTRQATSEIARPGSAAGFQVLDTYARGFATEAPRLEAIATISAGYRERGKEGGIGRPVVSRDGTIYLHDRMGRAPNLRAALEARGSKSLTIAFPFDDPNEFVQQRFVLYSATALQVYGDQFGITIIRQSKDAGGKVTGADHEFHPAGSAKFNEVVPKCKVSISVYFALAEWTPDGPRVVFPDGLGFYRLRTTSRNSIRSMRGYLAFVEKFSRGRIAGVPFDLALDYREVADPFGARREIPVWTLAMRPPESLQLTSRTFAGVLKQGLEEGSALMLPPPAVETVDSEVAEAAEYSEEPEGGPADIENPTPEELELLARGGRCDASYWRGRFFAVTRGTWLASEAARAAFVKGFTSDRTESLAELLESLTEPEAEAFLRDVEWAIGQDRQGSKAEQARAIWGTDEQNEPPRTRIVGIREVEDIEQNLVDDGFGEDEDDDEELEPGDIGEPVLTEEEARRGQDLGADAEEDAAWAKEVARLNAQQREQRAALARAIEKANNKKLLGLLVGQVAEGHRMQLLTAPQAESLMELIEQRRAAIGSAETDEEAGDSSNTDG